MVTDTHLRHENHIITIHCVLGGTPAGDVELANVSVVDCGLRNHFNARPDSGALEERSREVDHFHDRAGNGFDVNHHCTLLGVTPPGVVS